MPRMGMEPLRRRELVDAAIAEIGRARTLDVTVAQIARRAGVSSALAHHYFGGKEDIFLAAMRHILSEFGEEVRRELAGARTPRERLDAIIRASFAESCFSAEAVAAWTQFYVQAQTSAAAERLLTIYQRRLHSNLVHALRSLCADPHAAAEAIAALIDGLYIRAAIGGRGLDRSAEETVQEIAECLIGGPDAPAHGEKVR